MLNSFNNGFSRSNSLSKSSNKLGGEYIAGVPIKRGDNVIVSSDGKLHVSNMKLYRPKEVIPISQTLDSLSSFEDNRNIGSAFFDKNYFLQQNGSNLYIRKFEGGSHYQSATLGNIASAKITDNRIVTINTTAITGYYDIFVRDVDFNMMTISAPITQASATFFSSSYTQAGMMLLNNVGESSTNSFFIALVAYYNTGTSSYEWSFVGIDINKTSGAITINPMSTAGGYTQVITPILLPNSIVFAQYNTVNPGAYAISKIVYYGGTNSINKYTYTGQTGSNTYIPRILHKINNNMVAMFSDYGGSLAIHRFDVTSTVSLYNNSSLASFGTSLYLTPENGITEGDTTFINSQNNSGIMTMSAVDGTNGTTLAGYGNGSWMYRICCIGDKNIKAIKLDNRNSSTALGSSLEIITSCKDGNSAMLYRPLTDFINNAGMSALTRRNMGAIQAIFKNPLRNELIITYSDGWNSNKFALVCDIVNASNIYAKNDANIGDVIKTVKMGDR